MGRIARLAASACASLLVLFAAGTATAAPRILLGPVYGEGDVSDEAGAFGLLVLTALDNGQGVASVIPAGAGKVTMDRAPELIGNAGAEILVIAEVDRLGPMLIASRPSCRSVSSGRSRAPSSCAASARPTTPRARSPAPIRWSRCACRRRSRRCAGCGTTPRIPTRA
jgi:hypothetical protein